MEKKLTRQERERIQMVQTILQHAEYLFSINGYENTSMDVLSAACEYSKRTIYRYFNCKEDLYFAVMLKGHNKLLDLLKVAIKQGQTGYERIKLSYKVFYDFYIENVWLFDLMSQIKSIKSKKGVDELLYYEDYSDCIKLIYSEIISLFSEAHTDKSIRTDIDAQLLGFTSTFILNGFFNMLRLSGDSFTSIFHLDKDKFIEFAMKLLFQTLGSENNDC